MGTSFTFAGALLVVMGLMPKVGAIFSTIPAPVIGCGGLIVFAWIFSSSASIVHRGVDLDRRNLT